MNIARERLNEHRAVSPHRAFRLTRRSEIPRYRKVPAWWRLTGTTGLLMKAEWKKIALLVAVFAPVAWVVSGIYSQDFSDVKLALGLFEGSSLDGFTEATLLLTGFFTAQGNLASDSLIMLNILGLLLWLSFIWVARYAFARKHTTMREALYTSGAAFVPFLLLLLLLTVQLIPTAFASLILNSMAGTGFVQGTIETALFIVLAILLVILSLYLLIGTVVALQIVALPGMYPWRALRNARKLIGGRRFSVLRKLIMLAIIILFGWLLLFTPMLLLDNAICATGSSCWSTVTLLPLYYYALTGVTLAFASFYVYIMYRSLLEED